MVKRLIAAIALSTVCIVARSIDTSTGIFDERFRTLRVDAGALGYPPVINLGSDDTVEISFDELADERSYLRYKVVHCNADWQSSRLVDSQVLEGFNEGIIENYEYSRMAYTRYVHYSLQLPDEKFQFKVSGNYLLQIFREEDMTEPVIQQRIMVNEGVASVGGTILFATDVDYRSRHQQLEVEVDTEKARVDDPFNDLTLVISQNGRADNQVSLHHPLRVDGQRAVYAHQPELIFPAGNDYRRFESISTTVPTSGVEIVEFQEPYYRAFLTTDLPRNDQSYFYDLNLHGNYVVRERDSDDSDIDADYIVTYFTLEMPPLLNGGDVFIEGDLTNRRLDSSSRMTYNQSEGRYEKALLLKQGAYSYQYLVTKAGNSPTVSATQPIEGDHYETRNQYIVAAYHRDRFMHYDRLIGFTILTF